MVDHDQMKDQLVSLALGDLSEPQRSEVAAHVAQCESCRAELGRLDQLLQCASRRKDRSADESLHESARKGLFAAVDSGETRPIARPDTRRVFAWRRIMASPIFKLGVAAVVAIAVALFGVSNLSNSPDGGISLLAKACAAERSLFTGTQIVHIQNEIVVQAGDMIGMGFVWLPMCSVKPDGSLRFNQLKLSTAPESYIVTDHSWYDPTTGHFSRILKAGDAVVFANSYDGVSICDANVTAAGVVEVRRQPVAKEFRPPESPAAYLGLAAGLPTSLSQNDTMVQGIEESTLPDGKSAHVFTVGTPDPNGVLQSYWLFTVRDEDSTITQKQFILLGRSQLLIRRVLTESVEAPAVTWDLSGIEGSAVPAGQQVSVMPDMVIQDVSIRHMVERAKFQTYVFSVQPSWTGAMRSRTASTSPAQAAGCLS